MRNPKSKLSINFLLTYFSRFRSEKPKTQIYGKPSYLSNPKFQHTLRRLEVDIQTTFDIQFQLSSNVCHCFHDNLLSFKKMQHENVRSFTLRVIFESFRSELLMPNFCSLNILGQYVLSFQNHTLTKSLTKSFPLNEKL